jgi:hypothetical protein
MKHDTPFPNMVVRLLGCALDVLGCRLPREAIIHLPYCWHDVPGTSDLILLNRLYKPISVTAGITITRYSMNAGDWVDYADYPELMAPRDLVHGIESEIKPLWGDDVLVRKMYRTPLHAGRWFHHDGNSPLSGKKYRRRLADLIQANLDVLEGLQ